MMLGNSLFQNLIDLLIASVCKFLFVIKWTLLLIVLSPFIV